MADISGNGVVVRIFASVTFPIGFELTSYSDDADPFDIPSIKVRDHAMTMSGRMISWLSPTAIAETFSVVPGTKDDENLSNLLEANRFGYQKIPANDVITISKVYPDGTTVTLQNGVITDGMPARSVNSNGRYKTNSYMFAFENQSRS